MTDVERRLHALADDAFPPVPDVRAAVAARIAADDLLPAPRERRDDGRARRPAHPRGGRRTLALAAALVVIPTAAAAAVPETRAAILDWLGLAHVRVERVLTVPAPPALHPADLGTRVASVEEARRRAGFDVAVPRTPGRPDAVYVTADGIVSLAYEPRPGLPADPPTGLGLLVTELRAGGLPELVYKTVGPGTRVESVRVDGVEGVFLSGAPHKLLVVERPDRSIRPLPARIAGNALAFERGDRVTRLEGRFDRRTALAIARSLRGG